VLGPIAPGDVSKAAERLLDGGVSAARKDEGGMTCYLVAAKSGNDELVQVLVDRGVRVTGTDARGSTGLHLACEAVERASERVEQLKKTLERALSRDAEARQRVLDRGGTEQELANLRLDTPGAQAEYDAEVRKAEGCVNLVKAFVQAGVDTSVKNDDLQTAMDIATRQGVDKRIGMLLAGGSDEAGGEQSELLVKAGGKSLHQAVYRHDEEAVRALIALGADVNQISDDTQSVGSLAGNTPLALALRPPFDLALADILLQAGADANFRNDQSSTALASLFSHDTNIRVEPRHLQDNVPGKLVALMKQYNCDLNAGVNAELDTLLCHAIRSPYGGSALVGRKSFKRAVVDALMKQRVDVNKANAEGGTPLMYCCEGSFDAMEDIEISLLEAGADVNARDKNGATPLHYAASNSRAGDALQLARQLFDFGKPDVGAVNNAGKTPLDIAGDQGNEPLVKLLLGKMQVARV
jgi:ankyrin repeat protein